MPRASPQPPGTLLPPSESQARGRAQLHCFLLEKMGLWHTHTRHKAVKRFPFFPLGHPGPRTSRSSPRAVSCCLPPAPGHRQCPTNTALDKAHLGWQSKENKIKGPQGGWDMLCCSNTPLATPTCTAPHSLLSRQLPAPSSTDYEFMALWILPRNNAIPGRLLSYYIVLWLHEG